MVCCFVEEVQKISEEGRRPTLVAVDEQEIQQDPLNNSNNNKDVC
jgi:hypothetical protein